MTNDLQPVPPQTMESELAAIGAMLLERQAIDEAMGMVRPEDFYAPKHRILCECIYALRNTGDAVDTLTLGEFLRGTGQLEAVGGMLTLTDAMKACPTAAGVKQYCAAVRRMSQLRAMITAADRMMHRAYNAGPDDAITSLVSDAQSALDAIGAQSVGEMDIRQLWQWEESLLQQMQSDDEQGYETGLITGIGGLDDILDPLQPGDFVIVAGRPSMGKSAFAAQMAIEAASLGNQWAKVLFFSVEMSGESLASRYLQYDSGLENPGVIKTIGGRQHDKDHVYRALQATLERHKALTVALGRPRGLCAQQIVHAGRRMRQASGLDLVVVDYLQLLHANKTHRDQLAEVTAISRELKEAAITLKVPLICVSQLSRMAENRSPRRPMLSDLRDSGAIEQDADAVIMLYRPGYYGPDEWRKVAGNNPARLDEWGISPEDKSLTEIIIAKQRNGPTGARWLHFDMPRSRFAALARHRQAPAC